MESKTHWVYIVECSDGSLYTGYTTDIQRRVKTHNEGRGAKYTRPRLPVRLVYSERFSDVSSAMSREYEIKQLTRKQKLALINENVPRRNR